MRSSSVETVQLLRLPELPGAAASTGSGNALPLQSWSWSWHVYLAQLHACRRCGCASTGTANSIMDLA